MHILTRTTKPLIGAGSLALASIGFSSCADGQPTSKSAAKDSKTQEEELSRGHRLLLRHGFQLHGLVRPVGFSDLGVWERSNLTGVNSVHYHPSFMEEYVQPNGLNWSFWTWGDPVSGETTRAVPTAEPTRMEVKEEHKENLVAIQYRDEQSLDDEDYFAKTKDWLDKAREGYPNALRYVNQWGTETSIEGMRRYIEEAEPDMLSFGNYPYRVESVEGKAFMIPRNGSLTEITRYIKWMMRHRNLALEAEIPYALWLQAFKSGGDASQWQYMDQGSRSWKWRFPSESELRLEQFVAWAAGYTYGLLYIYNPEERFNFDILMFEGDGSDLPSDTDPTPAFDHMAQTVKESRNLGAALIRLVNTDIRILPGAYAKDTDLPVWSSEEDPLISDIEVENLSSAGEGKRGDVYIGYFKPLAAGETGGDPHPYFMIVNGLTEHPYERIKDDAGEEDWLYDPTKGLAEDTRQRITVTFDFGGSEEPEVSRLNRRSGEVETLELTALGESKYEMELVLPGGTGDLFTVAPGKSFVGR